MKMKDEEFDQILRNIARLIGVLRKPEKGGTGVQSGKKMEPGESEKFYL